MFDYQSPVEMLVGEMTTRIENACNATIQQKLGFNIDKEELVKALQYDRHQYEKGYQDGKAEAKLGTGWISVNDRLPPKESPDYSVDVIVTDGKHICIGYYIYRTGNWIQYYDEFPVRDISHWSPIPELPEEVNKNG